MLLPSEQSPWNCGYVLGAAALRCLRSEPLDLIELRERMAGELRRRISATQAIAAVSWLYLVDIVKINEDGKIALCN